jgi:hypothetical protein
MIRRLRRPIDYRKGSGTPRTGVEAALSSSLSTSVNSSIHFMGFIPTLYSRTEIIQFRIIWLLRACDVHCAQRERNKKLK